MSTPHSPPMPSMKTPCVRVCVLAPNAGPCLGCGRTLDEISGWPYFTSQQREDIMADLPARLIVLRAEHKARKERGS